MTDRQHPYPAFNFLVSFTGQEILGGFSDASGLGIEITISEYRHGADPQNQLRKVPSISKATDVTLKRGIINSSDLWAWIVDVREHGVSAQRNVTVTLMDESGSNAVQSWKLQGVVPSKYTGPTLAAKGGGDVAMEELTLSVEGVTVEQLA